MKQVIVGQKHFYLRQRWLIEPPKETVMSRSTNALKNTKVHV